MRLRAVFLTIFQCVLILCLPLLLVTSNLRWAINSHQLYKYGFAKHEVSAVTGLTDLELKKVADSLIDYFNLKQNTAQVMVSKDGQETELFTEREIVHLRDVRDLVQLDYFVQYITLAIVIICGLVLVVGRWKGGWQDLVDGFLWGGILAICLIIVLVLWSLLAFDQLFLLFHIIGFPNDFWILDPSQHYLIMLFPQGFFYEAVLFILGAVLLEALIVGIVAFGIRRSYCLRSRRCCNS